MKKNIFSSKVFISFMTVCVYFLVIYFISDFLYGGNDDRGLMFILSGHYADSSYYTGFMSWYISMLLAGLYSIAPSFPFMGCFFLLCIFASVWYTTYYLLKKCNNIWVSVLLIVLLYIGIYRIICQTTFTYLPALLAIPLILITFELNLEDKKAFAKNLVLFSVFAILSIGIRTKVFLMLIPYLLIIIIVQNIKDKSKRGMFFLIPVVAVVCAFCMTGDFLLKQNPEYKYTMDYCQVRSEIMDFYGLPPYDENIDFYQSHGISKEAYGMMYDWYFDIPEASLENMIAIRDYQKSRLVLNLGEVAEEVYDSYATTKEMLFAAIVLAILSAALLFKNEKKSLLTLFGFVLGTILISLLLSIFMKFPERLAICLLLFNIAFYLVVVSKYLILNSQKLKVMGVYVLAIAFGLAFVMYTSSYDNTGYKTCINDYRQLEQHIVADADCMYVLDISLHIVGERMLNQTYKCANMYQNGWPIWFPSYNQQISRLGEKTFYDYIKAGKPLKYVASKTMDPEKIAFNEYVQTKLDKKFVKSEEFKDYIIYEVVPIT